MGYTRGALEFAFKITERGTGEETVVMSTPAMWAQADEYHDKLAAQGEHTEAWLTSKYLLALVMMAAAKAGIIVKSKGVPSIGAQADFLNRYSFEEVSAEYQVAGSDEAENPSKAVQEGGQEAE